MKRLFCNRLLRLLGLGLCSCSLPQFTQRAAGQGAVTSMVPASDVVNREGPWETRRSAGGGQPTTLHRIVELVPCSEAKPALSVQFIPNAFNRKEGNAALFYLQAMGFFEQYGARRAKEEFERRQMEAATAEGKDYAQVPPSSWRITNPKDLPLAEVHEYLSYTSFQSRYLAEAVQRQECNFDRRIQEIGDPLNYLLPEIQNMRELARLQSLRFLLAIAEDRTDDAVVLLGQQLALGSHLGQDPFLVTALVGMACAGIGLADAYYLCEHQDAPNMYWAVAMLPRPLVDIRPALAFERETLFLQSKVLAEVDEVPRSNEYWSQFTDELVELMKMLEATNTNSMKQLGKSEVTLGIAMGVPGARRYLREVEGLSDETINGLPNTQVFCLAMRRYYERSRDEFFKLSFVPSGRNGLNQRAEAEFSFTNQEYGMISVPAGLIIPAVNSAESSQRRVQQQLGLLQTVEAIRHHLATHGRSFPQTLAELELPAPLDPATDQAFEYAVHAGGATLTGGAFPGFRVQLELRVSPEPQ